MIRGIGPIYARKLVRVFGEAVFEVTGQEPGRLREVTARFPRRHGHGADLADCVGVCRYT
jgi:exodeoxyribonuclease V alpha subunit